MEHFPSGGCVVDETVEAGYLAGCVASPEAALGIYGASGESQMEEWAGYTFYESGVPAGVELPECVGCLHRSEVYVADEVPIPLDDGVTVGFYGCLEMGELEAEDVEPDVSEIATATLFG